MPVSYRQVLERERAVGEYLNHVSVGLDCAEIVAQRMAVEVEFHIAMRWFYSEIIGKGDVGIQAQVLVGVVQAKIKSQVGFGGDMLREIHIKVNIQVGRIAFGINCYHIGVDPFLVELTFSMVNFIFFTIIIIFNTYHATCNSSARFQVTSAGES